MNTIFDYDEDDEMSIDDMCNHPGLYYISESIKAMSNVDAVYFTKDWQTARGCIIEREVAKAYGVKILEYDFIEEQPECNIKQVPLTIPNGWTTVTCNTGI